MPNKELQESRMKGYFVQATKEILKGEGLPHVSVRNIAQKAGYSYATLYNYFKDVKELIFECVKDFQDECELFIITKTDLKLKGKEKIQALTKNFIRYFIEYPGIFELFYIEKTSEIESKQNTITLINSFLNRVCDSEWSYLEAKNELTHEDVVIIRDSLNYLVLGMLLSYNHRKYPMSYEAFMHSVDKQLTFLFRN